MSLLATLRSIALLLMLAICTMGASCTPSLIYDPALGLPAEPMRKEAFHVGAGAAMFPHARPEAVDKNFEIGGEAMVRYAFSDQFSMQGKWFRADSRQRTANGGEEIRIQQGVNLYGILRANSLTDKMPWALIPAYSLIFDNRTLEGQGGALWFAIWPWTNASFSTYFAAAPAIGFHPDITGDWEFGMLFNAGEVINLSKYFDLTIEAAAAMQYDRYAESLRVLPAPSISLVWKVQ